MFCVSGKFNLQVAIIEVRGSPQLLAFTLLVLSFIVKHYKSLNQTALRAQDAY